MVRWRWYSHCQSCAISLNSLELLIFCLLIIEWSNGISKVKCRKNWNDDFKLKKKCKNCSLLLGFPPLSFCQIYGTLCYLEKWQSSSSNFLKRKNAMDFPLSRTAKRGLESPRLLFSPAFKTARPARSFNAWFVGKVLSLRSWEELSATLHTVPKVLSCPKITLRWTWPIWGHLKVTEAIRGHNFELIRGSHQLISSDVIDPMGQLIDLNYKCQFCQLDC